VADETTTSPLSAASAAAQVEEWRAVVGFEDFYEVSSLGRVRSFDRQVFTLGRFNVRRGRVLAPALVHGYPRVTLTAPGRKVLRRVHCLVLEAFVGPRPPGLEIRHLNGVRADVRLENLAYGTREENSADRVLHQTSAGVRNAHSKLTDEDVIAMRAAKADGLKALAERFGISRSAVHRITTNRAWRHL
jgi:DNA-binding MarR family transcriptional regulator